MLDLNKHSIYLDKLSGLNKKRGKENEETNINFDGYGYSKLFYGMWFDF